MAQISDLAMILTTAGALRESGNVSQLPLSPQKTASEDKNHLALKEKKKLSRNVQPAGVRDKSQVPCLEGRAVLCVARVLELSFYGSKHSSATSSSVLS